MHTYPKVHSDFLTLLEAVVRVGGWGLILLCQLLISFDEPACCEKNCCH